MHWFILIPYYFLGSMSLIALLIIFCRVLRLNIGEGGLVATAIMAVVLSITASLWMGWYSLADYTGKGVLFLFALSFVLAGIDGLLKKSLPLTLDYGHEHHHQPL